MAYKAFGKLGPRLPPPPVELGGILDLNTGYGVEDPFKYGTPSATGAAALPGGASGQMRVGGQGSTGQAENRAVTALTPTRGKMVNRIGGNGGPGLPENKGIAPLGKATGTTLYDPYRSTTVMPAGGTGPGSALDKLPGYVEDYLQETDKTGGVRPGAMPEMNAVEAARARQRAMATPSGAPGIGGTGGNQEVPRIEPGLDPRKAALNAYRG